jgi:hypothetical protein
MPAWRGPSATTLPGLVADRRVLVDTDSIALVLDRIEVTPTRALRLILQAHAHRLTGMSDHDWWGQHDRLRGSRSDGERAGLPAGIAHPDGTQLTTVSAQSQRRPSPTRATTRLTGRSCDWTRAAGRGAS